MQTPIIERAFQMARGCSSIEELRAKLSREGYGNVDDHLRSSSLRADLKRQFRGARMDKA
jgi:hypothetical protein